MTSYRVSQASLKIHHNGAGNVRVSELGTTVLFSDHTNAMRISTLSVNLLFADKTNAVRVSTLSVYALVSTTELATPSLFDGGSIGSPTVKSGVLTRILEPSLLEPNPYKPTLPSDVTQDLSPAAETHAQSQQEMIRKQHNTTQAGDSTFPWDLLQQSTTDAQFNVGSVGRFFTPEFGIVHAVYVQFVELKTGFDYGQMPYGRLKSAKSVDWRVTNDFGLSGADLAVGIGVTNALPTEGDYGWLMIRGGNIATLQPYDFNPLAPDDVFTWGTTGTIRRNGSGKILARVWGTPSTTLINPGDLFIDVGGMSPLEIQDLVSESFDAINDAITKLEAEVAALQDAPASDYADSISKLQQAVQLLSNSLTRESGVRSAADSALKDLIGQGQITVGQFNDYKAALATQLAGITADYIARIKVVATTANAAKAVTDQLDPNYINSNIALLLKIVQTLANSHAASRSRFPVVTGEVPPVFVYLDDGNLVYVEE